MRGALLTGLLCFSSLASAASLSVDFTQAPVQFSIDLTWDSFSFGSANFSGSFLSNNATTGTDTVAIVDQNTGVLLDTLDLFFTSNGHDGSQALESFSGSVITGINFGFAPPGSISVNATGAPVDITALIPDLPANIALRITESSPSDAPEPASLTLIGLALAGFSFGRRHVRRSLSRRP